MNVLRLRALAPFALALLVGTASIASAQTAPSVTATVNGSAVSVQWTPVAGATLYDVIVTGALNGTVEFAGTSFVVPVAPPGTYNIQVRGKAGSVVGPLSNTATVTVGGATPGCPPPTAPTLAVTVVGTQVSIGWSAVDGAAGYRVELGQTPGGTVLAQVVSAGQLSVVANSPFFGTFYARVVAGNACGGLATSNEVAFTVGQAAPTPPPPGGGTGPRAADPVPGAPGVDCTSSFVEGDCMLPVPSYAAAVVASLGAQFPGEAAVARPSECPGGNNAFLFRVLRELRKLDTRWGLNYKRGNAPTLSEDIIAYNGTARPDDGESHVMLFDIVGGSCFSGRAGLNGGAAWTYNGTWNQRGQSYCGTTFCARWTLAPYIAAGFTP